MTTNLFLSKVFDTLVKREDGILLCKHSEIYCGAFGSQLCDWDIYIKDDYGQLCHPNEQLNYSDAWLEDMYEKVEPGDEDDETIYMNTDFGEEKNCRSQTSRNPIRHIADISRCRTRHQS